MSPKLQRMLMPPIVWMVCFLPWVALFHWSFSWPWLVLIPVSIVLVLIYVPLTYRFFRKGPDSMVLVTTQFMGVGSLGWMPAIAFILIDALWPGPGFQPLLPFLVVWIALLVYAAYRAQNVEDLKFTLPDPRIPKAVRMVQLSDLHIGSRSPAFLQKVVTQTNAHQPDVVVITGDLVDFSSVGAKELEPLKQFNCPVYMCTGNHERYVNYENAMQAVQEMGVIVLHEEMATFENIQFVGIDDDDKPDHVGPALDKIAIQDSLYTVVLYHRPDGWQAVKERNLPLILAGHTHNGQVWPLNYLIGAYYPHIAGWYRAENSSLYVSSGTGTWGPLFRLGTRCEIGVFDLEPAA